MTMVIDGSLGTTFPDTSTQASASKVLQVVNATYSTIASNATSTFTDTGLTASITPKFSTSKILVIVNQNGCSKVNNTALNLRLLRTSTEISKVEYVGFTNSTLENDGLCISMSYSDSPATTSSVTYKTQFASNSNSATVYVQNYGSTFTSSYITLMEIAQ